MSIVVDEIKRRTTAGPNPSADIEYNIYGTSDEVQGREAMATVAPTTFDLHGNGALLLMRDAVSADSVWVDDTTDQGHLKGVVHYARVQTADPVYTFEVGFGTLHVTHSLSTVARYAPSGKTAGVHKNMIGVTPDGVEGVDLPGPAAYRFTETHFLADSIVTPAYKATLFNLAYRSMNDAWFKGFASGECKFLGARGGRRGSEDWELQFVFGANPNETDKSIGDINGIDVLGWDYLWVEYEETKDEAAKVLVKTPKAVHVERVNSFKDYSALGIGI